MRCIAVSLGVVALTGCGGSDDGSMQPTDTQMADVTAVEVGDALKAAGAPITEMTDNTGGIGEGAGSDYYLGLVSAAEIDTGTLELGIEVYDSVQNRENASAEQREHLEEVLPELVDQSVSAECGTILLYGLVGGDTSQRADFVEVEDALAAVYGPC